MEDQRFTANVVWDGETGAEVRAGKFRGIRLDMPIKFGGKERYPCPDELFLSSVAGCLLTTFLYFMRRLKVKVEGVEVSVSGTLRAESEAYRMSGINATIFAKTRKGEEAYVKRCIDLTKKHCHITRTLEKVIHVEIIEEIETSATLRSR